MKKSGTLPEGKPETENPSNGIDFLGARITRDDDGTVWCDQSKYILHCMRENEFINKEGRKDKHLGFKFWGFTRTNPNMQKQCHTKVLGSGDGQQVLSNLARITPSRWSTPPETTSTLYGGILDG